MEDYTRHRWSIPFDGPTASALVLAFFLLGGCGLHLHNAADEERARNAEVAFKAADVDKIVADERQVVQATHQRDLAATRRNIMAERDAAIIVALGENRKVGGLLGHITQRQQNLGFPSDPVQAKALHRIPQELAGVMSARDAYLVAISNSNLSVAPPAFPPTPQDADAARNAGGQIAPLFTLYEGAAQQYLNDLKKLTALTDGKIGRINSNVAAAAKIQSDIATELANAKKLLDAAIALYKAEVSRAKNPWDDLGPARKMIEDALGEFDKISQKLQGEAKKAGLEDLLAEIQLQKLNAAKEQIGTFLEAFSKESTVGGAATRPTQPSNAEVAGRIAGGLVGAAKEVHESTSHAKVVPLLFEQARLRLEMERIQRMLDRGKQRISLFEKQREAYIAEALKLLAAANALNGASNSDGTKVVQDLLNDNATKGQVIHALFIWTESIAVDKLHEEGIEIALITLDHDEALDASEFALGLWKQTIASPLEELLAYHASGLKPDQIARFLQAAGLAAIAVGVN